MPTPAAPAVVAAADAVTTTAITPEGVTPPNAADAARMSTDQARDILRGAGKNSVRHEPDPLTDEGDGRDPLTDEGVTLEEVLGIGPETDQTEPEQQEQQESPAETEAEATAEEAPAEQVPVKTEADGRKRVNLMRKNSDGTYVYSEQTRAALLLADEEGIDYEEARQRLFGDRQPVAKAAEAAPVKPEPTAAEIDAQLADLEKKIEEAEDALDYPALPKLNRELRALLPKRQDALLRDMRNQQAQQESRQTVAQQQETSRVKALAAYPDAGREGTPLQLAAQARINRIWQEQSPLMSEPDLFETVVAMEAVRLGVTPTIAPKGPAKSAPVAKAAPVVATKRATPMPAPGSVSAPVAKVDPRAELAAKIATTRDTAVLKELMREAVKLDRAA